MKTKTQIANRIKSYIGRPFRLVGHGMQFVVTIYLPHNNGLDCALEGLLQSANNLVAGCDVRPLAELAKWRRVGRIRSHNPLSCGKVPPEGVDHV